ncbi:MAG: prephenate dehydratase domain-containing protein [bacterium]
MKVHCIGPQGSNGYLATTIIIKDLEDAEIVTCHDYSEIFEKIISPDTVAVLPIKNKISGDITRITNVIGKSGSEGFTIIDDITIPVIHCLISKSEDLSFCSKIYLHDQARIQCSDFLESINLMEQIEVASTSAAVAKASKEKDACAIGTIEASEKYVMNILSVNIGNDKENWTKFVLIKSNSINEITKTNNVPQPLLDLRQEIDEIDQILLQKIKERYDAVKRVGEFKKNNGIQILDLDREKSQFEKLTKFAIEMDINPDLVHDIWRRMIDESYKVEG